MGLNEQQEILKRTAREFLEAECPTSLVREIEAGERGYSPELWKKMSELGWLGMALPPEHGGGGGNLVDQVVLFEELGRAIVPSPILTSTVLSGQTLLRGASEEQKRRLIPRIAGGDTVVTVATTGMGAGLDGVAPTVNGVIEGGHFVINGTAMFVPYAHLAEYILCPVETTDGQTLFLMESQTPGITITLLESVANYKQHEVHFNDVIVPEENMIGQVGLGADPLRKAGEWATVVQCGELVGRAEKVLEMVVEYSKSAGPIRTRNWQLPGRSAQVCRPHGCHRWRKIAHPSGCLETVGGSARLSGSVHGQSLRGLRQQAGHRCRTFYICGYSLRRGA